eukprot:2583494-Pleurochrysis_carterae.AAC.2
MATPATALVSTPAHRPPSRHIVCLVVAGRAGWQSRRRGGCEPPVRGAGGALLGSHHLAARVNRNRTFLSLKVAGSCRQRALPADLGALSRSLRVGLAF